MAFRCCFVFALIAIMGISAAPKSGSKSVGGFSASKPADDYIQGVADQVETAALQYYKENLCLERCQFDEYKVVSYKSQVVAGDMHMIKIRISPPTSTYGAKFIVMKVFVPLPYTNDPPELKEVLTA